MVGSTTSEMPPLLQWMRANIESIPRDLRYREAAINQMCFFRDRIATLFVNRDAPLEVREVFCKIAGWHKSKSVDLPVYHFATNRLAVYARDNFHNWNVTVISLDEIELPNYFGIDEMEDYLFMEGMNSHKCGPYSKSKRQFSFCVWDRYQLFAVMWCIASQLSPAPTQPAN